jgi:hypothetical protein
MEHTRKKLWGNSTVSVAYMSGAKNSGSRSFPGDCPAAASLELLLLPDAKHSSAALFAGFAI